MTKKEKLQQELENIKASMAEEVDTFDYEISHNNADDLLRKLASVLAQYIGVEASAITSDILATYEKVERYSA